MLDTTIALVALRYIAGGLSATVDDGEWVITSYLAANAIILPITGWLSAHLGRRNYFLLSIAVFTLASGLCGMATSLGQLIVFRVVQGLAGGGLQPGSQGILLDAFPREKQGVAMTLFGFAALIAPVVGPTLGGWITDSYSWRWVFLINAASFGASTRLDQYALSPYVGCTETITTASPKSQVRIHRAGAAPTLGALGFAALRLFIPAIRSAFEGEAPP